MPPAAILDIDGTLVDTNYHHAIAWYRAFRQHDIILPVWRIHRHIGMGGDQLVGAVAGDHVEERHGDSIRGAQDDEYSKLIGETAPFEGAAQLLRTLKQRGHRLVLASSAKRAGIPAVAILTGGFSEQELRDAGAVAVFESVEALSQHLDSTPLT
jgi:phosphoglycolate phosphatase-like HAD superfamily hydrolase